MRASSLAPLYLLTLHARGLQRARVLKMPPHRSLRRRQGREVTPWAVPLARHPELPRLWEKAPQRQWDHYGAKLTFAFRVSAITAARIFETEFIPRLRALLRGRKIAWLGEVEAGPLNGTIHIHVVLFGTADLSIGEINRAWRVGKVNFQLFEAGRGGVGYVTKESDESQTLVLFRDYRLRHRRRQRRNPSRQNRSLRRAVAHRRTLAKRLPEVP